MILYTLVSGSLPFDGQNLKVSMIPLSNLTDNAFLDILVICLYPVLTV